MSPPASHSHHHSHSSVFSRHPVATGIAVGVASLAPHFFLPTQASLAFAAILIALIAGIYFGFAVAIGTSRDQLVEFNVAGMFAVTGLLGLLLWPILLPAAYFAHACWDLAHHNAARRSLLTIPSWYIPWCVIIDLIVGTGLLIIWRGHGII